MASHGSIIDIWFINTLNYLYSSLIPYTGDSSNLETVDSPDRTASAADSRRRNTLWMRYRKSKAKEVGKQP